MKTTILLLIVCATMCLGSPFNKPKDNPSHCRCIPFQQCLGETDPSVYCQPWYGMACCIFDSPRLRVVNITSHYHKR
ncbi:hypothetical protein FQR65_LT01089 [Abscondita terminalis]|nr:hypothetical protein FQR65_LT01089 [Abscondita terminalis]